MKYDGAKEKIKFHFAKAWNALFSDRENVWLIGENLGKSNSDNGFLFFDYIVNNKEENAFFLVSEERFTDKDLSRYGEKIVKLNSLKHYILFFKSRYCIVSHGIRDAVPQYIVLRKRADVKPVIYLQHGVVQYKKIYYNSLTYNKSILRFLASSEQEKKILCEKMCPKNIEHELNFLEWKIKAHEHLLSLVSKEKNAGSNLLALSKYVCNKNYSENLTAKYKEFQKYVGLDPSRVPVTGLPRYDTLLSSSKNINVKKKILVFPTWREYLAGVSNEIFIDSDFYKSYKSFLESNELDSFLNENNARIVLVLHTEMNKFIGLFQRLETKNISISSNVKDLQKEILESKLLVTDYSSIAWEFSILKKRVVFYHFDFDEYLLKRGTYAETKEDWNGKVVYNSCDLVDAIKKYFYLEYEEMGRDEGVVVDNCCEKVFSEIKSIPKKIYFVVYNIYGIGGTVKTVINNANYFYSKGYDVEIISLRRTGDRPKLGLNIGIKIKPLYDARKKAYFKGGGKKKKIKNIVVRLLRKFPSLVFHKEEELYSMLSFYTDIQLIRHLRKIKGSYLITTMPSLNRVATKFVDSSVVKIGQEHRTYYDHSDGIVEKCFPSYKQLDLLTVVTSSDKENFENKLDGVDVKVLSNGTFVATSFPVRDYKDKRIVGLGRFKSYKGFDLLIEAFSKISQDYPDWKLDIYGDGEERNNLESLVVQCNLENSVSINHAINDVDAVLQNCSVFALPSRMESFGMTIIEANANGVAVVAFDKPYGPKSLIEDGVNGLLAKSFNVDDFAEKLSFLMEDEGLRENMGRKAHEKALKDFSISSVGEDFEGLLSMADEKRNYRP